MEVAKKLMFSLPFWGGLVKLSENVFNTLECMMDTSVFQKHAALFYIAYFKKLYIQEVKLVLDETHSR